MSNSVTHDTAIQPDLIADAAINFAAYHNNVPPIKRLAVTNAGDTEARDLQLRLWIDRDLSGLWTQRIDRLDPGQAYELTQIDLPLRAEVLAQLTERDSAELHLEVCVADEMAVSITQPIDALAFDEWAGINALPELLAAFVTPNHPAVERLLGDARRHLELATGDDALSGYQRRDPQRVRQIAQAVYRAVGDLGVGYINPPASFEQTGQRIRLADQIVERRLATCLDLTLLVAALLEQCGLNPLLVLTRGHAFVGVWLTDDRFPEPAVTEPLRLRKRVQLEEIVILETTGLTHSPAMDFEQSRKAAMKRLEDPAQFHYAVDVRTARTRRIRPLPLRVKPGTYDLIDLDRASLPVGTGVTPATESLESGDRADADPMAGQAPVSPVHAHDTDDGLAIDLAHSAETQQRLDRWKRKLLDLSLRNRVLNHRDTKKTIPLAVPDLGALEDRLTTGERFAIAPRADLMAGGDPRSAELHEQRTGEDAARQFLAEEVAAGRLHADLTERELDKRLLEIYRAARLGMEESGANTLYLAFGFLSWYETPTSEPARLAPILLIPAGLERLPAGRGYQLSLIDEDPRINVTLLEKLRTEYGIDTAGLEELTEDDAGLDVPAILKRFRTVVKDIPRWDVVDRVDLGLFSFNKFLMWRDLHDRGEALGRNPIVCRLIDPANAPPMSDTPLPDPAELDATRPPGQTLCPMDADSSQLAAVFAADEGHSFVLEGPPGTGKSQTITNLIAQCLSQGKRVLFVSEKMAALSVVYRRLQQVGLGPFCLELHSNKASKRAVLDQLGEAMDLAAEQPPEDWRVLADQLDESRSQLNALVEAQHRRRPLGLSCYQATCELVALRDTPELGLGLQRIEELDANRYAAMRDAADRLATAAHAVGAVGQHPYRAVGLSTYTASLPDKLFALLGPAEEAVAPLNDAITAALDLFKLGGPTPGELSADAMRWLVELGTLLDEPCRPTPRLLTEPGFAAVRATVSEQVELGRQRDAERQRLLERYDERVLREDLGTIRNALTDGMTALPILSWFKCYGPRKRLKLALRPGAKLPTQGALLDDLDTLIRVRDQTMGLSAERNPGQVYAGDAWGRGEAQWDEVLALLDWAERYRRHFDAPAAALFGDEASLQQHGMRLAINDRDAVDNPQAAQVVTTLRNALEQLHQRLNALDQLMHADADTAWGAGDDPGRLDTVLNTLIDWRRDPSLLRDWTHWCATRNDAATLGLSPIIDAHAARAVPAGRIAEVLRKSVLSQWLAAVTDADPALASFHRQEHERRIERFRELDQRYLALTALQVRAALSSRVPVQTLEPNANSEVGVLRRQMKLKRRQMPVRKLLTAMPNLLPRLKPCLLMSPLSVAQYLDTGAPQPSGVSSDLFDLVVFDEASQIPVWDAVGVLARGRSCVVVGDSKQLPPTSFFQKLESDAEVPDENEFEELESILDECSASGLPSMRLLWHYRSRHESLIAFSNAHYYDGRLNTFPSPADESDTLGVTFRYIDSGVYDRGSTCTNRVEAEALIADVVERLRGSSIDSYQSIGIVTFSMAQQVLIEDLLDQARREEPGIDPFFTSAVDEPVFIKNLENVQGDERAEIYFSVCYGPDPDGKVAMNFGPLNREGGERRLNVAITRARRRVVVYSSLRADQVDLTRTQAVGVAHLRAFLDYARRGTLPVDAAPASTVRHRPTGLDLMIADALRERGHAVDLHVGLSGYRVALAVRDPSRPDAYLLGVELDGPYYRSAPAARDRDRTRPGVMHGLGWRLHRVWSADVLRDPAGEVERIEHAIERAKRGESFDPSPNTQEAYADTTALKSPRRVKAAGLEVYSPYLPTRPAGDADTYYNEAALPRVRRSVLAIAKREAPIHRDLLAKRLTLCWQIGRLTSKAAERAALAVDDAVAAGELQRDGLFVWLAEQDPAAYSAFRVPADGEDAPRDIDEVPARELQNAAIAVLRQMIAMPRADLLREIAELFGYSRVTTRVQPTIDQAVQGLLESGRSVIDAAGNVTLA